MNQPAKAPQEFNPPAPTNPAPVVMPSATHASGAMAEIEQSRAVAEIQGAMVLAKRFPRDQRVALDRILLSCQRLSLAEVAEYSYSRGGTAIEGPTIRLAEAIAQNWGNIQFGIRELEKRRGHGNLPGESTVEAFAWDLETNTKEVKVFQVPHWRDTKSGGYAIKEERDIYELVANMGARRLRSCILGIIPGDVVQAAIAQCDETLKNANKNVTPENIKSMVEKFSKLDVSLEQIQKRIQRNVEAIDAPLIISLGKIYNSIKDGMSKKEDWFDPPTADELAAKAGKLAEASGGGTPGEPTEGTKGGDAADPNDWDSVIDDELLPGLHQCKTDDQINAYLTENQARIAEISKSGNKDVINRWARAVSSHRTKAKGGKLV